MCLCLMFQLKLCMMLLCDVCAHRFSSLKTKDIILQKVCDLIITNWCLEAVCSLIRSVRETLTLGTLRNLAPARAAARPEKGRSSVGENSPAGSGGAGGGGGAPGGRAGPGGGGGVPFGVSVGGSGGGGGGGGWLTGVVGVMAGAAVAEVTVEPGGRGGGGGGVGAVSTGLCTLSDGGTISG